MDRPLVAVVLAGGTGTRLYPATRSDRPKQFQPFGGERSMLAETVRRANFADEVYVLTRPAFAESVREHAPSAAVLTEPAPRDTGPALVYAAHRIREQVGECVLCCLPSDHRVDGDFQATVETACAVAARTGSLVTIGIEPTRAETGYGYVEPGADHGEYYEVESFTEKPDAETAQRYVESGYLWNSGTFAWTPTDFLAAASETELRSLVEALEAGNPERGFEDCPSISVDYAVLESAENVAVVPASYEWDDLGSWDAFERLLDADGEGNVALGEALAIDASDNVFASDGHVAAVGVEDLVIASFDDRTLVLPKSESQRVREVVERLRKEGQF
ncbi:mannose-1-phosphate guanylyltransferase [Halapricum salinum]|uniref:Mannose-1-phosphate guanylyltransferase n=1 Tax=Halapricum salinum TaxID=1457250 RepID=A0A4D6HET7_9EURY|nr:sugar phosphate nucleotidyltransferase [Halapricum salinum]QCC52554.1 mannose-1-phosphate guanylyltransferase [Halapricum salinum]